MSEEANLFAQQEANRRRSRWLVIGFILFFAWVGFGGDLAFYLLTADAGSGSYHHVVPYIGIIATLGAGVICWYAWKFGPEKVLWATGAWELVEPATPEQKQLVNVVEEMAIASGVPKPRIWIVPDTDPNAFATGRDAATASIAVTEGLLGKLSRDELQAVVAHEVAHIRNLDVRLMTLLAGMVGAIALMSDGLGRMIGRGGRAGARWSGGRGGSSGKGNPLGILILVLWLLTLMVAPVVSRLLAMAVSRKREYLADATGAPDGPGLRTRKAGVGNRPHSVDHPRRRAPLHRGSGTRGAGVEGRIRGRLPWLAPADPAADHPASRYGVSAG